MDCLYALGGIMTIVAVALLLGWAEKHVKSPAATAFVWIGSIIALLSLGFGFRESWNFLLLLLLAGLIGLEHIPSWVFYLVGIGIVGFVCWYFFNLLGNGMIELAQENADIKARMTLLESSLGHKLDDISSRLPERE
jgi:hypothetical protein